MSKTELTVSMDEEKMQALSIWLKKENTTVQRKLNEELQSLYEQLVPKDVREYLDMKNEPTRERTKRSAKPAAPKSSVAALPTEKREGTLNG